MSNRNPSNSQFYHLCCFTVLMSVGWGGRVGVGEGGGVGKTGGDSVLSTTMEIICKEDRLLCHVIVTI